MLCCPFFVEQGQCISFLVLLLGHTLSAPLRQPHVTLASLVASLLCQQLGGYQEQRLPSACLPNLPGTMPSYITSTTNAEHRPQHRLPEAGDGAEGAGVAAALRHAQVRRVPRRQAVAVPLRPERHGRIAHLRSSQPTAV